MRRVYVIATKDNRLKVYRESRLARMLGKFPKEKNGYVIIDGSVYVLDPKATYLSSRRTLILGRQVWYRYHFWRENVANPVKFMPTDEDISGDILAMAARSRKVEAILKREMNLATLIIVLLVIVNIILVVSMIQRS